MEFNIKIGQSACIVFFLLFQDKLLLIKVDTAVKLSVLVCKSKTAITIKMLTSNRRKNGL